MIRKKDGQEGPDRSAFQGIAIETKSNGLQGNRDDEYQECRLWKNGPIRYSQRNEGLRKRMRQLLLVRQTEPKDQEWLSKDQHQAHNTAPRRNRVFLHD